MEETILYVTVEVTLKDGVNPDDVRDELTCRFDHDSVDSSEIVDIELGD